MAMFQELHRLKRLCSDKVTITLYLKSTRLEKSGSGGSFSHRIRKLAQHRTEMDFL